MQIPPALVLGCNTLHGIGVLSDWIEEQGGFVPDFVSTPWSDTHGSVCGDGDGYGNGYGDGRGDGDGYGNGWGDGYGDSDVGYADGDGLGESFNGYNGNGFGGGLVPRRQY